MLPYPMTVYWNKNKLYRTVVIAQFHNSSKGTAIVMHATMTACISFVVKNTKKVHINIIKGVLSQCISFYPLPGITADC